MIFLGIVPEYSGGALETISNLTINIENLWGPTQDLLYTLAAIIGMIGSLKVYKKWNKGHRDVDLEVIAWMGSCVFLIMAALFVGVITGVAPVAYM